MKRNPSSTINEYGLRKPASCISKLKLRPATPNTKGTANRINPMKAMPPDGNSIRHPKRSTGKIEIIDSPSKPGKLVANIGRAATDKNKIAPKPLCSFKWARPAKTSTIATRTIASR